jgi:hypothetical protein
MNDIRRAARHSPPLDDMPSILVDLDTALDVARSAKRRQLLLLHVAKVAVRADEVRAPGRLGRAELLGRLAGEVGHDQVVGHPGRAGALVDSNGGGAFAGLGCREGKESR